MRRAVFLAALLAAAGCQDHTVTGPKEPRPSASIVDGRHNSGNPHFFFLPPLVANPQATGVFDPTVDPRVEVCELAGAQCGVELATFTLSAADPDMRLRLDTVGERYSATWRTLTYALDTAHTYRLRVLIGSAELGYADVDVVASARQLRNVQTGEYVGLLDGHVLPIAFRIEVGAVPPDQDLYAHHTQGGILSVLRPLPGGGLVEVASTLLHGFAFDFGQSGLLYVGTYTSLDIFDRSLVRIASVSSPRADAGLAVRPGQVFACNAVRLPAAQLLVFDVGDSSQPVLQRSVAIPGTADFGGLECRGLEFDAGGRLWVASSGRLIRLDLATDGGVVDSMWFDLPYNPLDVAIPQSGGQLFYSAVNANVVVVADLGDPRVPLAVITEVCDNAILSPLALAQARDGTLNVSCSNYDGATTDIVSLSASAIATASGSMTASSLGAVRMAFDGISGGGFLAFGPRHVP